VQAFCEAQLLQLLVILYYTSVGTSLTLASATAAQKVVLAVSWVKPETNEQWHMLRGFRLRSDELTRVVLLRVMAVGSVQAVGYGMTKPQRWLVIDSAKFARWLVRHLWGNFVSEHKKCVQAMAKIHPSESSWQLPLVPLLNSKTPKPCSCKRAHTTAFASDFCELTLLATYFAVPLLRTEFPVPSHCSTDQNA